ncbi:hypothetical protein PE067_20890 [Paracoccus sp. DMF-8]|uniref:hypothetical protein n=1 Tax=Paracoccus sp. DMF-8 TaxID=3019445 RepID=UPI0023E3F3C8|nr:hypothetical protein [Paracoccus sp. DMF-8]MDF3608382.1 hypothetical protein [Paracoccus sp. DMF-8]
MPGSDTEHMNVGHAGLVRPAAPKTGANRTRSTFFPFEVADPRSGLHYRLNAERLTELSLAPRAIAWPAGSEIGRIPDPVWAASFENAPGETLAAVGAALEDRPSPSQQSSSIVMHPDPSVSLVC